MRSSGSTLDAGLGRGPGCSGPKRAFQERKNILVSKNSSVPQVIMPAMVSSLFPALRGRQE